jgi:hypothetical protein
MISVVKEYQIFKVGGLYPFEIQVNETKNVSADNTVVTFTPADGVTIQLDQISQGAYSSNVWTIGSMVGKGSQTGKFNVLLSDPDLKEFVITAVITTTSNELNLENNLGSWTFKGFSESDIVRSLFENTIAVDSGAFSNPDNPTNEELEVWVDANVPEGDQTNGTMLTYNSDPFNQSVNYTNATLTISQFADTTSNFIGGFVYVNGAFYNLTVGDSEISTSASFDEAAYQVALNAMAADLGFSTTFIVTDNLDGSGEITIEVQNNDGIYDLVFKTYRLFGVNGEVKYWRYDGVDSDGSLYVKTESTGKYKSPNYIWSLNAGLSGYDIVPIHKTTYDGNVLYVAEDGNDETAEIGNRNKAYKTLNWALIEGDGGSKIKVLATETFESFYGFTIPTAKKVFFECNIVGGIPNGLTLTGFVNNGFLIQISGSFINTGYGVELLIDGDQTTPGVMLKDCLFSLSSGDPVKANSSVPIIGGISVRNIVIQNVVSNNATDPAFVNELGETILINLAYQP